MGRGLPNVCEKDAGKVMKVDAQELEVHSRAGTKRTDYLDQAHCDASKR